MIFKNSRKNKAPNCTCDWNFTCHACLQQAVDRNGADKNNSTMAWQKLNEKLSNLRPDILYP